MSDLDVVESALEAALADLVARLVKEQREGRTLDPGVLARALGGARAASTGPASPARIKEHLGRWSDEALVRELDPPERLTR